MSQQYDNEMRFVLFKNDKQGNEKRPDYRGEATIDGTTWRLSAWIKTDKNGQKFMAGQIELPKDRTAPARTESTQPEPNEPEGDVPF
jgi:hypothetical protein